MNGYRKCLNCRIFIESHLFKSTYASNFKNILMFATTTNEITSQTKKYFLSADCCQINGLFMCEWEEKRENRYRSAEYYKVWWISFWISLKQLEVYECNFLLLNLSRNNRTFHSRTAEFGIKKAKRFYGSTSVFSDPF